MYGWLGAGTELPAGQWTAELDAIALCSVTACDSDGNLTTHTALMDGVRGNGTAVSVHLIAQELAGGLIANPRVLIASIQSMPLARMLVIHGIALTGHEADSDRPESLLRIDVSVQRVQCWDVARSSSVLAPGRAMLRNGRAARRQRLQALLLVP